MSRFDREYLELRNLSTWREAYLEISTALGCPATSIKQLRDEFDPLFPNQRAGWRNREVRPEIRRTFDEIGNMPIDLMMELVHAVAAKRTDEVAPVTALIDPIESPNSVAERLRTGRLAEEWFFQVGHTFILEAKSGIVDRRLEAVGYDFHPVMHPEIGIEVKGIVGRSGGIMLTEREKSVAAQLKEKYWLAVVSNVQAHPSLHLVSDPLFNLEFTPRSRLVQSLSWQVHLSAGVLQGSLVAS